MQQVETEFSKRRSKKEPEAKRLGSIQTVAQKLDLGVRTTYTMIKDGRLPLKPIHLSKRCVRYDMKALERWISSLVEGCCLMPREIGGPAPPRKKPAPRLEGRADSPSTRCPGKGEGSISRGGG